MFCETALLAYEHFCLGIVLTSQIFNRAVNYVFLRSTVITNFTSVKWEMFNFKIRF